MRFIHADQDSPLISELTRTMEGDLCTLRWHWPASVQAVYIRKTAADQEHIEGSNNVVPNHEGLKLYTKAEYKSNNGYHTRMDGIGRYMFTVYACQESEGGPELILQPNGGNTIEISAGKAKIHCSIKYKTGLFQKYKTIQITVTTEVPIGKDVLCYVKKQGGYPANKEDGTLYPFVSAFSSGKNTLPAIEVGKQDYIRIFFTDGRLHGQMYELISV